MFGVQDKILQGILLLGPSNTLHILPIGKVSQPRSRCNTMDGYGRRATDPRPNVVIRTLRRQHRCFTTESVLWPNNPIIGGWAVLFTPWKYIFQKSHRVDSSAFDLCSRWRPCKGSSQLPAGRGMMIMKIIVILIDSKRTKCSLVKNTSEYSEHKWIKTGTSPLGSLQQVWSSLHENDGSWGHLWLPLGKNNDSLFLHLYFKLVAASGQKRISLLCKLVAYCSQGKKILVMYTHFSLPEILASSSWAYIVHTSRERKSKEQRSLIFCWSPKSRRVCVDMWVTDLILN